MSVRKVVIDSSVALKWRLRDEDALDEADALLDDVLAGKVELLTPSLFDYEITSALKMAVVRSRLSEIDAQSALADYWAYKIERRDFFSLQALAFQLANQYQRSTYDATYLALAQSEGVDLLTGDKRLFNAVNPVLNWVKWIGDYQSS